MQHFCYLKRTSFFVVLFLFFAFSSVATSAQESNISIGVQPSSPKAYEQVTITASSISLDLDRSRISWFLDGVSQKSGVGEKDFSFTTKALGKTSTVRISVSSPDEPPITETILVTPQGVDILWNALTYVPPFYDGKALPSSEGLLLVTAFPEIKNGSGTTMAPNNLFYEWRQDGSVVASGHGIGKRSIVVRSRVTSGIDTVISVIASLPDRSVQAENIVRIQTQEPVVLLYEKHPLQGILYERALVESVTLTEKEFTLRAEPFFFSWEDVVPKKLLFQWSLNDSDIETPGDEKEITVHAETNEPGVSKITVHVLNLGRVLQEARSNLFITF